MNAAFRRSWSGLPDASQQKFLVPSQKNSARLFL